MQIKKSVRRLIGRLLSSQRQTAWLCKSLLKHAGCYLETTVSQQLFHMIDGSKKVSVTVWLPAFHTNPCFILFAQRKELLQKSLYLFANELHRTWKMNAPNWWCFSPSHSDASTRDLVPEGQSGPVVKGLSLALKQTLLAFPFPRFFRDCHHTGNSSCEACVHRLWSKIQRSLSR